MNVFETTVRFYTDHNFVGGDNNQSYDERLIRAILQEALKHMDSKDATIIGQFAGVSEYPTTVAEAIGTLAEPVELLRSALRVNQREQLRTLALERFRDHVSTHYGVSDKSCRVNCDVMVLEGCSARYPRVLVTVQDIGDGDTEEEAADNARFNVAVQTSEVLSPDKAGHNLTWTETRALVVGMARTFLDYMA